MIRFPAAAADGNTHANTHERAQTHSLTHSAAVSDGGLSRGDEQPEKVIAETGGGGVRGTN